MIPSMPVIVQRYRARALECDALGAAATYGDFKNQYTKLASPDYA